MHVAYFIVAAHMNIGILTPGFSANEEDWAIPFLQNLVGQLAQTDDVRVIALRYPHQRQPYSVNGAQVYPLGYGAGAHGLQRMRLWLDALRLIRRLHHENSFDVLHAIWSDETGLLASWAGRWLGIPTVTSIAGGELVGLKEIGYGSQCSHFGHWTVGQALRSDAVVVSGSSNRSLITQAGYHVPESKIHTITWGVDNTLFTPFATLPETRRLLHVGSLVPVKNQAMLLRALARLDNVELDIVGTGYLLPDLQRLAAELGIAERVHFLGSVPYTQMPKIYQRAALLVMTSRSEVVPMTILEAAACGVPTIGTHVGVLPDHLALGVTVPVGDDAALALATASLLNDTPRLIALRQSASQTVPAELSVQHTAVRYRDLHTHLMSTR
jgi:glycosyltransferase involved in cell wall biosynthesis